MSRGITFVVLVVSFDCFCAQNTTTEETTATTVNWMPTTEDPSIAFKEANLDWTVWCKFQPNGYDCSKRSGPLLSRFYYDIKMEGCKSAEFGKCPYNVNQFSSLTSCHQMCRDSGLHQIKNNLSEQIACRLQPDFGYCNDYYPMWYYDMTLQTCRGFSYSGCGGNGNRFATANACASVCAASVYY